MADVFIYRIDHHGSLVRPPELAITRDRHAEGEASDDELREVQDQYVAEAIRTQRKRNQTVVTDGHFRRSDVFSVYADAIDGLADGSVSELRPSRPLLVEDTLFVRLQTSIAAKATLPSPASAAEYFYTRGGSWQSPRELGEALAEVVRNEIEQLLASDIPYVQLDNHDYGFHLDSDSPGPEPKLSLSDAMAIDAMAVEGIEKPDGAAVGICPAVELRGDLDESAASKLFSSVPVNRWILPYHTGNPVEFDLVKLVPDDLDVCLGVVDAAKPELEDADAVLTRLDEVDEVRDWDRIALSPNRGFADIATKPLLDEDDQWAKMVHVDTLARMAWGNEL